MHQKCTQVIYNN